VLICDNVFVLMILILKIMNFKNVFLTKIIHFVLLDTWIHYIDQDIIFKKNIQHISKLGMKNAKIKK
jgi:hypothetical protein